MRQRSNLIILFGIAFFLVGGLTVFLVLGEDGADGSGGVGRAGDATILVATEDIAANTFGSDVISGGKLRVERVAAGTQPSDAITGADLLENKIFAVPVGEGEPITTSNLLERSVSNIQVPQGYEGMALQLEYVPGGGGYVAPGDRINVFGVFGPRAVGDDGVLALEEGKPTPRAELLLTNILVLDVSRQAPTSTGTAAADPSTATNPTRPADGTPLTYFVAVTTPDAERLVLTQSFARLYLSLTADDAPPVGDTAGADGGSVAGAASAASAAPQS